MVAEVVAELSVSKTDVFGTSIFTLDALLLRPKIIAHSAVSG
jgi:hypothetical protein